MSNYPNLYERFRAVRDGREPNFNYTGPSGLCEAFKVELNSYLWYTVTRVSTGRTAKAYNLQNSIDFMGVAACLIRYPEQNLLFDKKGEIVNKFM